MKKLHIETTRHGVDIARVHDYQSGHEIGRAMANWDEYRLWAEGQSDVCEARRCLPKASLELLGISEEAVIFLLD